MGKGQWERFTYVAGLGQWGRFTCVPGLGQWRRFTCVPGLGQWGRFTCVPESGHREMSPLSQTGPDSLLSDVLHRVTDDCMI